MGCKFESHAGKLIVFKDDHVVMREIRKNDLYFLEGQVVAGQSKHNKEIWQHNHLGLLELVKQKLLVSGHISKFIKVGYKV